MDWKKLVKRLVFLPLWQQLLLTVISTGGLIFVFAKHIDTSAFSVAVYVLSFYTLAVLCTGSITTLPKSWHSLKKRLYINPFTNHYLTDRTFKTHVNLYRSLSVNLLYVVLNAISAAAFRTHWFAIFAVYYGVMALMRFVLAEYLRQRPAGTNLMGEYKVARVCACMLMTINFAITAAVLMMIYFGRGFSYQGFFIYVMALYTFYITAMAIADMVRCRKSSSSVIKMAVVVRLASALVSMLFLETAMLAQFGTDMSAADRNIMIMATGGGISAVITALSAYMIIQNTKEIKNLRRNFNG